MLSPLLSNQSPPPSPKMASPSLSPKKASPLQSPALSSRGSESPSKKVLNPSFADLPSCLLDIIMSNLDRLKDNIRASSVCKSWCGAALSVRGRLVEKHPWLMCFLKRGKLIQLRDPVEWKLYTLDLPELAESSVCYSRDGWLLMRKTRSEEMFFFNPFTRELLNLPKCELDFDEIAFSCPPTSDTCVVLAIMFTEESEVIISTCHPGATEWITEDDFYNYETPFCKQSNLVYCNGQFYCFFPDGFLRSFHPSTGHWETICPYKLPCPYVYDRKPYVWKEKTAALAEKKGKLFVIFTCSNEKPMVYRYLLLGWEKISETSSLDHGLTIFVSSYNSELRTNIPGMRNKVYFSTFGYNRKRCVSYSFGEDRYNPPKQWQSWVELCPRQSVWINPPENVKKLL